ncbi:MAG TPA: acyltransferase [Gemmataceae bacterium]|nr:acyltransferase [Gemmataceae bacterium]
MASLDLLRLLAVVFVLGRHLGSPPSSWPEPLRLPFLMWVQGGWVGVDLFFVLSGFLVSGLLFTEYKARGSLGIGRFYTRRGWKIYPPFYVLIATTVIVSLAQGESIPPERLWPELLFLQSYWIGLWGHTWSLAVEEHFYLLLPLALTVMLRRNRKSPTPLKPVLALTAVVAVASLALRVLNWHFHFTMPVASHLRLDSLFFGVAISYLYHFHTSQFVGLLTPWRRWLIAGGALLLTPPFVFHLQTTPLILAVGLTAFYIGSGMLMVGILLSNISNRRPVALLAALGAYSYSIYLWHMPVRDWGIELAEWIYGAPLGRTVQGPLYLVGSFVVGVVMAKLVEVPVLRLRDRWFPARSPGAIEEQPASSSPSKVSDKVGSNSSSHPTLLSSPGRPPG